MKVFTAFTAVLLSMLVLDGIWLLWIAKRFYASQIGHLMANSPKLGPVVMFYLIYALGLTFLVVLPAIQGNYSLVKVFGMGALIGLMAYGAYDFTNHATLRDWPTLMTIVDLLWGTFLTGTVVLIATYIVRYLS